MIILNVSDYLRDVYEGLGIPITKESWVFEENNVIGDNYIVEKGENNGFNR